MKNLLNDNFNEGRQLMRSYLLSFSAVTILFFISLEITKLVVVPVQDWFGLDASYAALLFLPHGIRVVTTYLLGPLSGFLHLAFATFIVDYALNFQYYSPTKLSYSLSIIGAISAPLAYMLTKFFVGEKNLSLENVNIRTWRIILLVCLLSSVINSLGQSLALNYLAHTKPDITLVLKYMAGDFFGAFTVFLLLMYLFRKLER